MAITITTTEIKLKAAVAASDTSRDSAISALISQMQGPIEYSIADRYIADTSNSGLQATLKLGMVEIIAGEFVEQMRREVGASEEFSIAGVSIGPADRRGLDLIQQGATRLEPYLKCALPMMSESASRSTTSDDDTAFSAVEEVW